MRTLTVATVLALTLMTAGCGENDTEPETAAAEPTAPEALTDSGSGGGSGGDADLLVGVVGTPENPDAFEITLMDGSGEEVTELPAGDYSIVVQDLSEIHNFHLMGQGVDESTTVPETGEVTWDVTFTEGDYEAICDPHPGMQLEFTVT